MAKEKPGKLQVTSFADHHVITQPNPLRKVLLRVPESDLDDPVGRAEKALAGLSGEFKNWMAIEADRLSAAHAAVLRGGFTDETREELFRAAHDIKGDAATFGFPSAGAAAESLCRIIEHAPDLDTVPADLIASSHQRHSGHRARAHQARHRRDRDRAEPAAPRHRRRIPHPRQSRPPRAPRSHPRAEHRSGGVRSPLSSLRKQGPIRRGLSVE